MSELENLRKAVLDYFDALGCVNACKERNEERDCTECSEWEMDCKKDNLLSECTRNLRLLTGEV